MRSGFFTFMISLFFCHRSPHASTSPPSRQSPEPPMTPGEFDMLTEQLCFDINTVSLLSVFKKYFLTANKIHIKRQP